VVEARRRRLLESYLGSGEVLVSETQPGLLRLARSRGLDDAAAWDVIQQAYVSVYLEARELTDPESWLRTVVRRRSLDWHRRELSESAKRAGAQALAFVFAGGRRLSLDERIALRRALATLGPRLRLLVLYRYFEGYSEEEAARRAGYSPASAKKTLTRALAKLRRVLDPA
jgi:RNA polymerase sigma-70 factor (ECF subfamily)